MRLWGLVTSDTVRASWCWLRAAFSWDRIMRDLRALPYRGQPVQWSPRRGLHVVLRRPKRPVWRRSCRL